MRLTRHEWLTSLTGVLVLLVASGSALAQVGGTLGQEPALLASNLEGPAPDRIKSRLVHLFYFRDAKRVAQIVGQSVQAPPGTDDLQALVEQTRKQTEQVVDRRRQAEAELRHLSYAQNQKEDQTKSGILAVAADTGESANEQMQSLIRELRQLEDDERRLQQQQFELESKLATVRSNLAAVADRHAQDPIARVAINVVGEGQIHLRGPIKGVNKIARIVHQIDKPVGQVKVGIHTIEINGGQGEAMEEVHDLIDKHIAHARFMSSQASLLFRRAVSRVAGELAASTPSCEYAKCFCGDGFTEELERLDSMLVKSENRLLSLKAIDSLNLLGALYVAALADDPIRERILREFQRNLREEIPQAEVDYFSALNFSSLDPRLVNGLFLGRFQGKPTAITETMIRQRAERSFTFANLFGLLGVQSSGQGALNNVQTATVQLTLSLRTLNLAEVELNNLLLERSLLERREGEIEERAVAAKRELETARESMQAQRLAAEATVLKILDTVLEGMDRPSLSSAALVQGRSPQLDRFCQHLARLSDPVVQKELAPILLDLIAESPPNTNRDPALDARLAEVLYNAVADYMHRRLQVTFGVTEHENTRIMELAKQQIIKRADRLRDAASVCSAARESMARSEQRHAFAVQNEDVSYRRLIAKRLLDRFIDEQEEKVVDLWESLRSHVANVDGHLKRMAIAFEDDINAQFYQPAFQDIRRASRYWSVELGQIETTTILTNDRAVAKVSPSQTLQLDLPKRQILVHEAASGAQAVAEETRSIAQRVGIRAAASTAGPVGTALAVATPLGQPVGTQLQALVPNPELYAFEAGNSFEISPVIQPDGYSIAYQFLYQYSNELDEPTGADEKKLGRIRRHYVKAEVQTSSYELREISRFRVSTKAARIGRGVPLLESIPFIGVLFRPLPSFGSALQENIILADCVVYPTVFDLMGPRWLRYADYVGSGKLIDDERVQQQRRSAMREHLLAITRAEVDELIGLRRNISATAERPTNTTTTAVPNRGFESYQPTRPMAPVLLQSVPDGAQGASPSSVPDGFLRSVSAKPRQPADARGLPLLELEPVEVLSEQ